MALPPLMPFDSGDWESYIDEIYECFVDQIVNGNLELNGLPVTCRFEPRSHGKPFGFWHLTSTGEKEEERLPDLRRCERIQWIAWMIRNADDPDSGVTRWDNKRKRNKNIVLLHEEEAYTVIISKRSSKVVLTSAYPVRPRRLANMIKERDETLSQKG